MLMKRFSLSVLIVEAIGFLAIIAMSWMDELIDFPHVLGDPISNNRWEEASVETIISLLVAAAVLVGTKLVLDKMKYLEGFLPVCATCKKIRVVEKWVPIEEYISDNAPVVFSHSYCPVCAEAMMTEFKSKFKTQIPVTTEL